ncbi:MAG: sulfotransferase domain-containing protein [bacterium]
MDIKCLFKRIKYGKPIIIVSGLPRSGTSMVMKMLEAGGMKIASDGIRAADDDNPKGYYELERVKTLDKEMDKSWLRELRGRAVKIISYFLRYLPDSNYYKVIFIDRNLDEVVASQNKMLANREKTHDPCDDECIIKNFESHLWKIRNTILAKSWFEPLYLNHRLVLTNPREQARIIKRFLGGCLDEERMASIVDPKLYRNRK